MGDAPEPMATVPVSELHNLADLLRRMEVELADDYVAGLASRMLRDLSRRWADTVSVWAVEAELAEGGEPPATSALALGNLSPAELCDVVQKATARLAALQGRPPAAVLAEIAAILEGGPGMTPTGKEQTQAAPVGAPGIDTAGMTAWLQQRLPDVRPPIEFEVVSGGRSNLTYRVTDAGGRRWVVRRPPLGSLLPSAHDVAREYRIMAALGPTPVPVPPVVALCEEPSVNGAPFFVMEHVDGFVLRDEADVERNMVAAEARRTVGESLVDTLVALHDVDPDAVGLGDLGRKERYVERQLRRWRAQWDQGHTRDLPLVDEVHRRLAGRIPPQGPARIVHGDFRLDNVIVSPEGEVLAVLDWELCTLGDPLADVGLLLVYWAEPGEEFVALGTAPTAVPGFPTRAEVAARYGERSGRDLAECDYYVALGYWKLAIIAEGVWSRYRAGAYGDGAQGFEIFGDVVEPLLERATEAVRRTGR